MIPIRLVGVFEGRPYAYEVRKDLVTLGRDRSCDVSLATGSVSRFHCQLRWEGERWIVKDLGSRNGTYLNGVRVGQQADLREGDELRIGKVALRVQSEKEPTRPEGFVPVVAGTEPVSDPRSRPGKERPTPVDLRFPPREVPAGSGEGPRLHSEKGQWYLKDPKSGRPVEVLPVASGDPVQAAVGQFQGLSRERFRRWLSWGVGGLVALAVAAALVWTLREQEGPSAPGPEGGEQKERYRREIEGGMEAFQGGWDLFGQGKGEEARNRFTEAMRRFEEAERIDVRPKVAQKLIEVLSFWVETRPDLDDFPWDRAQARLAGLLKDLEEETRYASPAVRLFATKQRAWLLDLLDQYRRVESIRRRIDSPELAQWEAAFEEIGRLPPGGYAERRLSEARQELGRRIRSAYLRETEGARAREAWEEALLFLGKAASYASAQDPELEGLRRRVEVLRAEHASLHKGRAALSGGDWRGALSILEGISRDSSYHAEAERLREEARVDRLLAEAEEAFIQGPEQTRQALERMAVSGDPRVKDRHRIMQRAVEDWQGGELAMQEHRIDQAVESWERIVGLLEEDSRESFFCREALAKLDAWGEPYQQADYYYQEGKEARSQGRFQEARDFFGRSMKSYPPNEEPARKELEGMNREAEKFFFDARLVIKDQPARARALLDQARALLDEHDPSTARLYKEIQAEWLRLGAAGGEGGGSR
jgi:tetratricopeptide (TPR) repeat protein